MSETPELLRLSEAARYLRVSRRWLYRRIWSGELAASKVGGRYFIRKADLDALIEPLSRGENVEQADREIFRETVEGTPPLKCGYCFRVITTDTQIGDVCQAPGCDAIICADCWAQGHHYCFRHVPDLETRWKEAVKAYHNGEYPVLLRSSQARFREVNFLERIRLRLEQIAALRHPQGEGVISIENWRSLETYTDERDDLMELLGQAALDAETLARYPLNARLRYAFPPARKKGLRGKALRPAALEVWVLSHMETMVREGYDTSPFTAEELQRVILQLASEVEAAGEVRWVILAATTGWSEGARALVTGSANEAPFVHHDLLLYLYDMERRDWLYNALDARVEMYAELLRPALASERVQEAAQAVEEMMGRYDSLAMDEALQAIPYSESVVQDAFQHLASTGRFALVSLPPEGGWALVRK